MIVPCYREEAARRIFWRPFENPYHVKQTKELDDNSPTKNDRKDPKTIAKLVSEGRYAFPYMREGIYADLRQAVSSRDRIVKELDALTIRIQRWLQIYFPEFLLCLESLPKLLEAYPSLLTHFRRHLPLVRLFYHFHSPFFQNYILWLIDLSR